MMKTAAGKQVEEAFDLIYTPSRVWYEAIQGSDYLGVYVRYCESIEDYAAIRALKDWLERKDDPEITIEWSGW
jgi:hypothetical protein